MQEYPGEGVLEYRADGWATLWVDDEIARYYRSTILTPGRHKIVQRPRYPAHITLVNGRHEPEAASSPIWGKHSGERVPFTYKNEIHFEGDKWFIKCQCVRMEDIRSELGLSRVFAVRPPHIAIANCT